MWEKSVWEEEIRPARKILKADARIKQLGSTKYGGNWWLSLEMENSWTKSLKWITGWPRKEQSVGVLENVEEGMSKEEF